MTDSEIISGIAARDHRAFDYLYDTFKRPFIGFLRLNYGVRQSDALDIFQDACAALYNNVVTGRLTAALLKDATLKTYLFAVGKKILMNMRRKRQTDIVFDTDRALKEGDAICEEDDSKQERLALIRRSVKMLKPPCDKLLNLKIWRGLSSKEIADEMGYSNENSAKTQVHKCRQKLINYVKSEFNRL